MSLLNSVDRSSRHTVVSAASVVLLVSACTTTDLSPTPVASTAAQPSEQPIAWVSPPPSETASPTLAPAVRNPAEVAEGIPYLPEIDPSNFVAVIDNPYMPLIPGSMTIFEGGDERIEVTVTDDTRVVMGVTTTVVRDQALENGELIEDTFDWFAQDRAGNVWYFGEDTAEIENGHVLSKAGSWEGGVDGAQPGVVMLAEPAVGDRYRQEFYAGEAEDMATVIELGSRAEGPLGPFDDVLVTEDITPLEPGHVEHKSYAPGIGVIEERLVSGGNEVIRLVEIRSPQTS